MRNPSENKRLKNMDLDNTEQNCELCHIHDEVKIYNDSVCCVIICPVRKQPMIVLNRHAAEPTHDERLHMIKVKERLYPDKQFQGYMTHIVEHYHSRII